jgi:hydrogenase-4 component E
VQDLVSILSVLLILLNFRLLGTSRLAAGIQTAALQAVVLGVLPILANPSISAQLIVVLVIATILKAGVLPWLIRRSAREASVQSEVDPILGFTTSLLVGVGLFAACISIANRLHMPLRSNRDFLFRLHCSQYSAVSS